MSSASRAALRAKRSKRASSNGVVLLIMGGVVVLAFMAAIALTSSEPTGGSQSAGEVARVSISGDPLPDYVLGGEDLAVGMKMPAISGTDLGDRSIVINDDGHPKIVLFLAHWCPHCQAEVPLVQAWLDGGGTHGELDIYSISTGVDPNKPNYPPSEWLAREGWTAPLIVDDRRSSAGEAVGLTSYPFFVFVDEDGVVQARAAGELTIPQIEEAIQLITPRVGAGHD